METLKILWKKWKDGTLGEVIREWRWILSYSRRYWKAILFYVVLGIFGSVFGLVSAVAGQKLIDIVTGQQADRLLPMAIYMVSMALFSMLFNSYIGRLSLKISIDIQNDIQSDIFEKIEDADWLELMKYHSGDILNRFGNDVGSIANNAITWLPSLVVGVFNFVATFLVIYHYDPVMGFLSLINSPFLLFTSQYLMGKMREYSKRVRELNSQMMSFEQETFANMNTIKAFGITGRYTRELKSWQKKFKDYNLEYNWFSIKMNVLLSLVGMLSQYAVFGWGIYRLWTGYITYGEMTLFLSQSSKMASAFKSLVGFLPSMLNSSVSAGRVLELVELPREKHAPEAAERISREADQGYTIRMEGVFFRYQPEKPVLTQSDFVAEPNEIVALVGPSGEGKTTMLRLILGLISPDEGKAVMISAQGEQISMNADTRHLFSYVPQGNTVFSGTIADNLRMVNEEATEEQMEKALRIACAWDFVQRLPEGIYTKLGERGRGLSEGQAQRIAIARALLRQAPIMLLDEATSALDVATERQVLRNIMQQTQNKTCIVATHRPSVLSMCSRVYRVMQTRVTQLGEEESAQMVKDF